MKISIALAAFNGGKYLKAQLESFLAQTRLPDELIIIDDGSNDNTLDIIRSFVASAPFSVSWSQNENNLGYSGNFNKALMKTTGDLVFLSDQDDVWFPEKIAHVSTLALAYPQIMVFMNDAALTDADLRDTGLTKLGQIYSAGFSEKSFVMGCCAAVRREFLDICLPIPNGFPAHDDWIVGIADDLDRKFIIPYVLQYYRRHGNNQSQWIVNRTTRVTWWHIYEARWRNRLSQWFKYVSGNFVDSVINTDTKFLMLEWAKTVANQAPLSLQKDLVKFRNKLQSEQQALAERKEIRMLPLPKRALAAFEYWRTGRYIRFSGLKSAFRDVLKL